MPLSPPLPAPPSPRTQAQPNVPMHAPAVLPLVHRHAQDAAFYWQLLDSSANATGLGARRALHFAQLQSSHLEGLELAGRAGLELSMQALQRWRKPGEAFAAFHTALLSGQADTQHAVLAEVARNPPLLLRAVVSSLSGVAEDVAKPWISLALEPLMNGRAAAAVAGVTELSEVAALRCKLLICIKASLSAATTGTKFERLEWAS